MDKPEHFEMADGIAVFRPAGCISQQQAVQGVTSAIAFAREQGVKKLLVDITGITGLQPPSLASRYNMMHEWAGAARGRVCVAMVARPEMIDPQKFGVTVASNIGMVADVFEVEEEALAWLRGAGAPPAQVGQAPEHTTGA